MLETKISPDIFN